jgi:hypothetical protein
MKTRRMCGVICIAAGFLLPGSSLLAGSRARVPNDVSLELGGKCLLYSLSYQRMVTEPIGLEVGVSMLGGGSSEGSSSILFFSGCGRFYFIQKDASPYISAGFVGLTASSTSGPFSDSGSSSYGFVGPGFEYRAEGGFLVRGSVYALIAHGGFFVWPGVTIGIAF